MAIAAPYINAGNDLVLSLVPADAGRILDVGCGAGDNARRLKQAKPDRHIVGITHSRDESEMASPFMAALHIIDIERDLETDLGGPFDLLLFSHVLEHTRDPLEVLRRFLPLLAEGGHVLIAVPNTLEWRTRLRFLRGQFNYADSGILDRTHLRFFTYQTAARELLEPLPELRLVTRKGRGALPFGRLRRRLLPGGLLRALDEAAVRRFPNILAGEVALLARRRER
jgi:SAM-dependent methyltransferase